MMLGNGTEVANTGCCVGIAQLLQTDDGLGVCRGIHYSLFSVNRSV